MKRFLLYAMMTAGVLASCSQGENDGLPQGDSVNGGTDAAPILLSAVAPSASVEASTRSAGTVGGKGDANVWSGQRLHIFAFVLPPIWHKSHIFNKTCVRKLFKTPISERWGKQIYLNE